jgi:hypothetical protein
MPNFFGGGPVLSINTYAANTTLNENDYTALINTTAGNRVVTLPPANAHDGRIFVIKRLTGGANTCVITPTGADTIDGAPNLGLVLQWERATIQSDGTLWYRID